MSSTSNSITKVIFASSVGTLIEWYDFYLFGTMSITISEQFFPKTNSTAALLSTLAIFAAGFIVRPFGALVFGRLGDLIGRKYTFLLTLILMGGSTFLIGMVPTYKAIGIAAPILVLLLRLVQGLSLGGEYGGAATYVAEHSPAHRRGFFTSWIQTTATLGLFVALGVLLLVKTNMSNEAFVAEWGGWRYPFWFSILLVGVSIYIRLKMEESPLFSKLKKEGGISVNPLKESFGKQENFKMVLLALFGATMGQGVIWYTGQFYAQFFLENTCKLDFEQSRTIMLWAIAIATPFFVVFGWLSDKIGRKWIMLAGMLLGILCYRPIFNNFLQHTMVDENNPRFAIKGLPIYTETTKEVSKDYFLKTTTSTNTTVNGLQYDTKRVDTIFEIPNQATVPEYNLHYYQGKKGIGTTDYYNKRLSGGLYWHFVLLVTALIIFVTMVYGPIAAFLVELFPTKIRYTSMSLPYHIGNGVFGGLVPFIGALLTATYTTNKLVGLWYPIGIAALSFVIGAIYLTNKIDKNIND